MLTTDVVACVPRPGCDGVPLLNFHLYFPHRLHARASPLHLLQDIERR